MDIIELEKNYKNFYAPAFEILVGGENILMLGQDDSKESLEISNVTIDNTLEGADTFSFTVNNAFDITRGELRPFIDKVLKFDAQVEIRFGYGSQRKTLMFGILTSVKITFPSGSSPQAEVSGFDKSYQMMQDKISQTWNNKKDSDVVKEIADKYHFKTRPNEGDPFPQEETIHETEVQYQQVVKQEKESDFDFLKRLSENNYYEFFVFRNTLYFRKPDSKAAPVVTLEWNKSLISFSPDWNMAGQVWKVEVIGQETTDKKQNIKGIAELLNPEIKRLLLNQILLTILEPATGRKPTQQLLSEQVKQPVSSEAQAKNLAKAILLKKNEDMLKGSGESIGIPDILAGTNIALKGLGAKFSRTYYIEQTNHSISSSGYKTTFNVKHMADIEKDIILDSEITEIEAS